MYLMYYLNEKGERVYTLKVIIVINYIHNNCMCIYDYFYIK